MGVKKRIGDKKALAASKINWSYIAGFLDGEGSVVKNGETDYRISIPQTNEEVLKEILKFTKVGNICQVRKRKIHWKESWIYFVARQEDVLFFLKNVYPLLIVKRNIVRKFIPTIAGIVTTARKRKLNLQKKIKACKLLRENRLSYRAIGKKLKIDHGYVRRMILYK